MSILYSATSVTCFFTPGFLVLARPVPVAAERDRVRAIAQSLRKLVDGNGAVVGSTSHLVSHLEKDALGVPDHVLHDMLAHWGFSQQSTRLKGQPRRGWILSDARLKEIETESAPLLPTRQI